jgi:PEP-CTERM motif
MSNGGTPDEIGISASLDIKEPVPMFASLLHTRRNASTPLQLLPLLAALVLVLLMPKLAWADSCSTVSLSLGGPPVTCSIPEQNPELTLTTTVTGLSFNAQAQGMVLIYDDSAHTLLSDIVTFTNVGGVATITFLSDTDLGTVAASGVPILGQFTESKPIFISVALGNGNFLRAKICSDISERTGCSGTSDSISLSERTSVVPEPGTLLLFGTGLLTTGVLKFRRLLKRM